MTAPEGRMLARPYKGLAPYEEGDASYFFSRDADIQTIIANLYAARLTILYGPSGVGKSSVLQAGVAHRLHAKSGQFIVIFNNWQLDPLNELKQALAGEIARLQDQSSSTNASGGQIQTPPSKTGEAAQKLISEPENGSLKSLLSKYARIIRSPLMVVLDQFEEYFLYQGTADRSRAFAREFAGAVTDSDSPASFLISIREDSMAKLDIFERHIPNLFDNYLRLDHLDYKAAEDAIGKPLEVYNRERSTDQPIEVESGLVEDIIERVEVGKILISQVGGSQPDLSPKDEQYDKENVRVEPAYLQLVLTRLWDEEMKKGSNMLRRATLASLGNAEQIARSHLDRVMKKLGPDQQEVAARIFNYLVTPSGMKIAHKVADLASYGEVGESRVQSVVQRLSDSDTRILRSVAPTLPSKEEILYEIYHDALAQAILDWRSRFYSRVTFLEWATLPALLIISGLMVIDFFSPYPLPPTIRSIIRALTLVLINAVALLQVYRWFYRQVSLKVSMLPISGFGGPNVGILLGVLLTGFWIISTEWPSEANARNPLGTMNATHFIMYLTTIAPTLLFGFVTFLLMRATGDLFRRFFNRFELGFYGIYFGVCVLIAVLLILNWFGVNPTGKWISFP